MKDYNNSISVYRTENKYVLTDDTVCNLKFKLDQLLNKDEYSVTNSYPVRSLYFDSINNDDFYSKLAGDEHRKKIRLRTYDYTSNECKLELKEKSGDLQHKTSMWITKDDAIQIINGNYSVLSRYFYLNKDSLVFFTLLTTGCYMPVCIVEYDRLAYTYPMSNTRITFDSNIRASESNFNLFDEHPIYTPVLDNDTILEVKYDKRLPSFVSEILKPYPLNRVSVSKYCFSRKIFYDIDF